MQSILLRTGYGRLHNVYFFYTGYKLVTNGNLDFSLGATDDACDGGGETEGCGKLHSSVPASDDKNLG